MFMKIFNFKSWFYVFSFTLLAFNPAWADSFTGSISGDVRIEGEYPKVSGPKPVEYRGPCGVKRATSVVKLWKDRVMDVTIWLTPIPDESDSHIKPLETEEEIDGWHCEFWPKMVVVPPGSKVRVVNKDPSVQWLIINKNNSPKRQVMQEPEGEPIIFKAEANEPIHLTSGFYPWMEAWIKPVANVIATSATDWDGRFSINNLMPGRYILYSWHPSLGESSQEVVVEADQTTSVTVEYQMPENKPTPYIESPMLKELFGDEEKMRKEDWFKK